ncbi:NADH-quinone oxidoreductase subunit NuoN [Actinomycetes bacterium M1A6_2h]
MTTPSVEYSQLSPMLIVFAVAIAGVIVEAFVPARLRRTSHLVLSLAGTAVALLAVVLLAMDFRSPGSIAVMGAVAVDGPTLFLQGTILIVAFLAVLVIGERRVENAVTTKVAHATAGIGADAFAPRASAVPGSEAERDATAAGAEQTEVFPLTMFAVGGMLLFPASNDLLTMFVALEVFSLPLYLLCALARRRRLLSQESALKYFLLGAFSSAFFLFGVALLYGYAGTLSLPGIGAVVEARTENDTLLLVGAGLVAVGLLFKIGAVPFHSWIPDVYQGAPTPITAFMAAATKVAAFGAMLRIFYVALPGLRDEWRPLLWVVAIATMLLGAVLAVSQTDVKRMLAYSSVTHAGFMLTGVIAADRAGLSSTMFYLFAYGFSTLGAFAVVGLIRDRDGEVPALARWAGLGRRSPLIGATFALFLLAFAGIPLTSGFVGKFAVFQAAVQGGATPVVLVGILSSAIAAFFYVRVIVTMFFTDPTPDTPVVVVPSALTGAALFLATAVSVVLGLAPQPVLDLANSAAEFVR